MMTFIMKCYIIIKGSIYAAGTKTIWNGPKTKHPVGVADGKAE